MKKDCSCSLEPCSVFKKILCHKCFPAIHCNGCFTMINSCHTMHDTLEPRTGLKVRNTSSNSRYGQETVQLHFNSPSEMQCKVHQAVQKK